MRTTEIKLTGRSSNTNILGMMINELAGATTEKRIREAVTELKKSDTMNRNFTFYFGGNHLSIIDNHKGYEVIFVEFINS